MGNQPAARAPFLRRVFTLFACSGRKLHLPLARDPAAQLVGAPDDERKRREERELSRGERGRAECVLKRRHIDQRRREGELEVNAPQQQGVWRRRRSAEARCGRRGCLRAAATSGQVRSRICSKLLKPRPRILE